MQRLKTRMTIRDRNRPSERKRNYAAASENKGRRESKVKSEIATGCTHGAPETGRDAGGVGGPRAGEGRGRRATAYNPNSRPRAPGRPPGRHYRRLGFQGRREGVRSPGGRGAQPSRLPGNSAYRATPAPRGRASDTDPATARPPTPPASLVKSKWR